MKRSAIIMAVFAAAHFFLWGTPATAADDAEARDIVDKARLTLGRFKDDTSLDTFQTNIKKAKGVLIFPRVLKAAYIWGGSGGTGVLVVRDEMTDVWSQPVFYILGSVSFGLQIGAESAEVVMLAMSRKAIDSLYSSSFKLGADASVAAGTEGGGVKKIITADFISFAKTKGLYAGLNLEGSFLKVGEDLNRAYYQKDVRPVQIVVNKAVSNPASAELLSALKNAVK